MTPEIFWLTITVLFTAVLWVPYIITMIAERGLIPALTAPYNEPPETQWAFRLKKAHYNAVENLVIFAPLILILAVLGISTELTVMLAMVYFWVRVAHAVVYTFAIPFLRTLTFAAGFACQIGLALVILGVI